MRVVILGSYSPSLTAGLPGRLIENLVSLGHEVTACAPGDEAEVRQALESKGAHFHSYPLLPAGFHPWADFGTLNHLRSFLGGLEPDVVFSWTMKPVIYGSIAASQTKAGQSYSMVTEFRHLFLERTFQERVVNQALRRLYQTAFARNRRVFFQNQEEAALFLDEGLLPDHKLVQISGSDEEMSRILIETMELNQVPA